MLEEFWNTLEEKLMLFFFTFCTICKWSLIGVQENFSDPLLNLHWSRITLP